MSFPTKEQNMGLNLPMLLANNQPLETSVWSSAVGQYSPPISERNHQLRVPLSMSYGATPNKLNESARSLYGGSTSGNSDLAASPQKPMDTADIDDKEETRREVHSSPMPLAAMHPSDRGGGGGDGSSAAREDGSGGGEGRAEATDVGSSPIPNTNTHEAHQLRLMRDNRDQSDLDIKQELVDYFHAPQPPAPPESHRSFSSTEEMRLIGIGGGAGPGGGSANGPGCDSDDYAQDLRVSAAASAAATKRGLDFGHLMMAQSAHNRRRSTESPEEKYTPLNMRKVSTASSVTTSAAAGGTSAGHVLMNSLLSHESMSEDTMASGQQRVKSVVSQDAASTSAAAALYAESMRRDDCDFIGSNVSLKLRAMDRSQRIIAEKLISEVLFYGQLNELERSARIQPK